MKLIVKDLGKIQKAEIDLGGKLMLFTGYNNTGKTYLNYLLYGLYRLPYGRIGKKFNQLIEIEDLSQNTIHIRTNLKTLYTTKAEQIASIYSKLLTEYCTDI